MIGYTPVNPNRFRSGGPINGTYMFEDCDITLEKGTSALRQADNENVAITFADKTIVHGNLEVLGDVVHGTDAIGGTTNMKGDLFIQGSVYAGNLVPNSNNVLPSDGAFNSLFITTTLQAHSLEANQVQVTTVKAANLVSHGGNSIAVDSMLILS